MKHQIQHQKRGGGERPEKQALVMVMGENAAKSMVLEHLGSVSRQRQGRTQDRTKDRTKQGGRVQKRMAKGYLTFKIPVPVWKGYRLIGDSMMSRAGKKLTNERALFSPSIGALQLGLCVHGQTISQLCRLITSKKCPPVAGKILLMIGTNDVLKKVPMEVSRNNFEKLIESLTTTCESILVCTLPPIPKLFKKSGVESVNKLHESIKEVCSKLSGNSNVSLLDLDPIFIEDGKIRSTYFEMDKIHWNDDGIEAVAGMISNFLSTGCQTHNSKMEN